MSKNDENSRNKSEKTGKPFWFTVVFLACFYAAIGYFALMERPSEPIKSYRISYDEDFTTMAISEITVTEKPAVSFPVDINTADEEMLMTLDGIGVVLAERIIAYRESTPFKSKTEIMNVSGIGEGIYEGIAPKIFVSGEEAVTATISAPVITEAEITSISVTETFAAPATTSPPETEAPASIESTLSVTESAAPIETEQTMVNINTASVEEFATLPGIGQKLAENIVSLREALGGKFTSLYELLYADGLDEGIFNRIKDYIYL